MTDALLESQHQMGVIHRLKVSLEKQIIIEIYKYVARVSKTVDGRKLHPMLYLYTCLYIQNERYGEGGGLRIW